MVSQIFIHPSRGLANAHLLALKLIFYCHADYYINFKDLANDLYKVCL